MLSRWGLQCNSAQIIDQCSDHFEHMLSRIQREHDSALSRLERLEIDDSYEEAIDKNFKRP